MSFEGFKNQATEAATPFEKMASERWKTAVETAEEAQLVEDEPLSVESAEEIPEDGNLNLEKISHLEIFLESAEDVYADASLYEAQAMADGYKSLDTFTAEGDEVEGREVFEVLYDKLQEFQVKMDGIRYEKAPENGYTEADTVPITTEDVQLLQTLYDEMILLRDHIFSAYQGQSVAEVTPASESSPVTPESFQQESHSPQWEFTHTETETIKEVDTSLEDYRAEVEAEVRAFLESKQAKRIEGRLQKSVALAESIAELDQIKQNILHSPEFASVTPIIEATPADAENDLKITELRQTITEECASVTQTRDTLTARFTEATRTPEVVSVLDILNAFVNRAALIQEKANSLAEQDASVAKGTLEKYLKSIEQISKESELFVEGLSNAEAGMLELDESEELDQSKQEQSPIDVQPQAEEEVVISKLVEEPLAEPESTVVSADSEKVEENESQLSPQEQGKRVQEAMNQAYQNMFLSSTEMETVKAFQKQVKRLIETKADTQKIAVTIESLENYVSDLTEFPAVEHVPERMKNILKHVNTSEGTMTDARMTTNSLSEVVTRLLQQRETDESVTDERVVKAYKTLETFANDNESEWLTVCGMKIPAAGPEGVFGARSFREGLMVARDRHPTLVRSLSKQLFVDDIVRMLQRVPNSGLTQEQVDKITWLAREIDVPERIVATKQAEENTEPVAEEKKEFIKTTSVHVETPIEKAAEDKKRATLDIVSQDEEASVEITVARMAESTIAEEAVQEVETKPKAVFNAVLKPVSSSVLGVVEKLDPINDVVQAEKIPRVRTREKINPDSLTRKYLVSSEYSGFIDEYYSSPEAFEKVLQTEVFNFDNQHTDKLAEYFGEKRASAFSLLQNMSLEKIQNFSRLPYDEKDRILRAENVSYDSVVVWVELMGDMKDIVGENPDMQLGELFARWMIETEMSYYEGGTSASQFTL